MRRLDKTGKGIILMHDFHKSTAHDLPALLAQLKEKNFRVVQITSKGPVKTLAKYDAMIDKQYAGTVVGKRPMASVVRTISGK